MNKFKEVMAESNCEICKQKEADRSVNIGLDIGFHIGNYGMKTEIYHKVKPRCVAICSLYMCNECERKIKEGKYVYINVLPKLKKLIKTDLIKQEIIESLR